MFRWFTHHSETRRLRDENATLRDQLNKAAVDLVYPSGPGEGGVIRPGCQHAEEQYRACRNWVWSAVSLISRRVAMQRVCVARAPAGPRTNKADSDRLEPLDQHEILTAIARPRVGTGWGLKFVTVASLELTGRQLWFCPLEDGRRTILPIPTHWLQEITKTAYVIRRPGDTKTIPLPVEDCVDFRYPDPANPMGILSPLQRIASAVDTDDAIVTAQRRAFQNGLFPGMAIRLAKDPDVPGQPGSGRRANLNPTQRRQIVDAVRTYYRGVHNAGEPIIFDNLIESIEPVLRTIAEMDFQASGNVTKDRILQGFSTSPILLGAIEGANRASATVASEIFVNHKINPLCAMLSESMTSDFAPLFGEGLTVWLEPCVPHDAEMQFKRWGLAAGKGCVTKNELRRCLLNLSDLPTGGDVLISASGGGGGLPPAGPEQKAFMEMVRKIDPLTCRAIAP